MRIGFAGLGLMGAEMAKHLLKAGHELWVIAHRNRGPIEVLKALGAHEARDLGEVARNCDLILLCLTTAPVVEETVAKLMPHLRSGQIVVDTGTTAPDTTRKLARDLHALGVAYADAPMSGGPEQVAKGEAGALIGADDKTFAAIRPVVATYASRIKHFGPPGSGHVAKLISNYLVTGMIALVAESFTAARAAHVDWRDLYEVAQAGSGNSGVLRKMMEAALAGDFDGYKFSLANANKDIGYYTELAQGLGKLTPLVEAVRDTFADAVKTGHGGRNVSHLLDPAMDEVT
jgi:3-hydroxyisobutyrate dehydrogenase-like beta-hydroxyacid dehydrogenase